MTLPALRSVRITLVGLMVALPNAGRAASSLSPPEVTYLRSYRASFSVPTRMAVDASGNVYVTDPERGQVVVRAPNGRIVSRTGGLGRPVSIGVGSAGSIYVGDAASGSVTAFNADWQPVFQLGRGAGEFSLPNDLAVDVATGNLYVADSPAHLVRIYSATGASLGSFGGQGTGAGQFNFPVAIAVDAARRVLVVDQLNYRVQVFDNAGAFQGSFGAQGNEPGQFNMPQGVAIDRQGRIYVADSLEGRIQVFEGNGSFVAYIGDFGEGAGELRIPMSMVIDPSNRLFVAAANNARLEVFGLDAFSDPEAIVPAVFRVEPNPVERADPAPTVVGYIEVPGYSLDQIVQDSIVANGVAAMAFPIADHDGNGVPDLRVAFDRAALLATLPADGAVALAVSGTIGAKRFEADAAVQVTTCGPGALCSLGDADPLCNDAVCLADVGCAVQPKPDGSGCEDGNACTIEDACHAGTCVGVSLSCNDGNGCTDDTCDPVGGCVYANNAAPCDDGSACTTGDVCAAGVCSGALLGCDDANACTDDVCDSAGGCTHVNNATPCDDGDACTVADTCAGGACIGTQLVCDDDNVCTDDACNPASGCVHAAITTTCDDGNACTAPDICTAGMCGGAPLACDDGNVCTDDACDRAIGCVHHNNAAPCNDADPGTVGDLCDNAACRGQVVTGNYALLESSLESSEAHGITLGDHVLAQGDACAANLHVGALARIDGDAVGWAERGPALTFHAGVQISGNVASGGGGLSGIEQVVVGGHIDASGAAPEIASCLAARHRANSRREELTSLVPTPGFAFGGMSVVSGLLQRIPSAGTLGEGQIVVDARSLRLGPASALTLVGTDATTSVVVRIHGRMMVGRHARIDVEGLPPERVIFVVDGSVVLEREAHVAGSVFAARRVQMGSASSVSGAVFGRSIDLAPYSTVEVHPFVGW